MSWVKALFKESTTRHCMQKKYKSKFYSTKQKVCKTDQLVKKLCIGNLSNNWSPIEAQKTGLYGNIYDFVVDYKAIIDVKKIYDMHRYLMTKNDVV